MCIEGERYAELLSIFKVEFYLRFQVSHGLSVSSALLPLTYYAVKNY